MAEHIEYNGNFSGSQIDTLLTKIQSSQVFTTEEKTKLASLVNYDDTEVKEDISDIETSLDELTAKEQANENNILSEQAKTTGMTEGGSNYITVGGIRVYVSSTAPTGTIPDGSIWIGG